jgi:Zn-dependent peptidase ImmA (M78 family)/transcriptional regulator with XRE-family HTH domain
MTWQQVGARLAEARKTARLSQAELAEAVRLDRTAITKLEAGERKLDSLELARLAEVLQRPIEWFIRPSPPAAVSRRKSRDLTDESQADVLLDSLARDVTLLMELRLLEPQPPFQPLGVESVASAEAAARDLRKHLGLPPGPVWELQAMAERVGLFCFSLDLQDEKLDGSYLRLEHGGCAVVNGRQPSGRRRFTLVHELGHHILADDFSTEWIVGSDGEDRERLINAFAIHFLMPRESLTPRWQQLGGNEEPYRAALVLGAEYGVSWTAVLRHLCNLEFIDSKTHERLKVMRPSRADYLEWGVSVREDLAPAAVPPRFAQAVVRAYKRHKVSAARALELLHGTLRAAELPAEDKVPLESMRSQFDLE